MISDQMKSYYVLSLYFRRYWYSDTVSVFASFFLHNLVEIDMVISF